MDKFIGTKIIKAEPMGLGDYNNFKGWKIPKDEDPKKAGYLVGYADSDGKWDGPLQDGCHHISWSPKDVFESAYTEMNKMDFGHALAAARLGLKIAREGWNGKDMFVVYQKGYPDGISCNKQTAEAWGMSEGALFKCEPYLQIQMVNGSHSMWVPSINDVLSEDWDILI